MCQNTSYGEIALLYEVINSYSDCRHEVDGIQYYCTVSGGIAVFCQDGSSYTELLTCASGALETSKHKGKNKCTLYDEERHYDIAVYQGAIPAGYTVPEKKD